jgi:hypothetical protein
MTVKQTELPAVRELERRWDFGLDPAAGDVGPDKIVTGIHISDPPDPAPSLTGHPARLRPLRSQVRL